MARPYTMKRRAEKQAEARRRIVEATINLHSSVGPALTNTSMVAERAGVPEHCLYAHFPDQRSLHLACSGLVAERDPLPDARHGGASQIGVNGCASVSRGFRLVRARREPGRLVLWDSEHHALTKEMIELRIEPDMRAYREVLGAALSADRGDVRVMLGFFTWRTWCARAGCSRAPLSQRRFTPSMAQDEASASTQFDAPPARVSPVARAGSLEDDDGG